jgi:hypothetical protein
MVSLVIEVLLDVKLETKWNFIVVLCWSDSSDGALWWRCTVLEIFVGLSMDKSNKIRKKKKKCMHETAEYGECASNLGA